VTSVAKGLPRKTGGADCLAAEPAEVEHHFLGALHGENGNDDIPPGRGGLFDDPAEHSLGAGGVLVVPVPVGRLHDHGLGLLEDPGVSKEGLAALPQVAAEDRPESAAAFAGRKFDHGRAEDMAGLAEPGRDALFQGDPLFIGHALDPPVDSLGLGDRIERDFGMPGPAAFFLMALLLQGGVLFLELGRIEEDDGEKVGAGRSGQDVFPEALANELGRRPEWSRWTCVRRTKSSESGATGKGAQFLSR
jgi:hypothetical protein